MIARRTVALVAGLVLPPALACSQVEPPRSVLLISLDTTRADRLGCYGFEGAGTPHIDGLAARGLRVERALAPVPLTLPSHTTLMTGLEPPAHGVRDNGLFVVADAHATLAEELGAAGLTTAAFVSAYPLTAVFGLDQGFGLYEDRLGSFDPAEGGAAAATGAMHERRGDRTVDRALLWLDRLESDEPFFTWVHLFDPHYPLVAPEPFASRFREDPYQAEVSFADAQVGRLLTWLEASGRADSTLVVLTADHGEGLGEHGEMSHGNLLYDGTQRVPLVLAGPGVAPGAVTPGPVGLARVAPTVRAFAGLPPGAGGAPLGLDGSDAGGSAYLETAYPRIHFGWSELYGLEREGWKYVVAPGAGAAGGGRAELRRVDASGEGPDELATRPDLGARLAAELAGLRAGLEGAAPGVAPVEGASLEALEALGYVGADLTAADSLGGDLLGLDPRLVIGANTAANLVRAALAMGDEPAARIQLAEIERLDPDGILLHESRGFVALARGLGAMGGGRDPAALDEALAAFEAATRLAPGRRGLWQKLAEVQLARDEPEAALLAARHAASLAPPPVALVELLGALEGRLAHELEAARSRGASARVEQLEQLLGLEPQP